MSYNIYKSFRINNFNIHMKIQLAISLANTILAILKNKLKQFFILFVTSAKHIKLNFISYLPIIYISTFILY